MRLKNLKLSTSGNSYCLILPKSIVEKTDIFGKRLRFDIEIEPSEEESRVHNGPIVYSALYNNYNKIAIF